MREPPSQDTLIYSQLHALLRNQREVAVPWPEHPSGELRMYEKEIHYRRPWDVSLKKGATVPRRILILGDSHTEGYCRRREAFVSLLDAALSPTQVINCGISGWCPVDALRYYRHDLEKYQFDDVVLVCYAGNDLAEMFQPGYRQFRKKPDGGYEDFQSATPAAVPPWKIGLFGLHVLPDFALSAPERRILRGGRMWAVNPGSVDQQYEQQMFFTDNPDKMQEAEGQLTWIFSEFVRLARQRRARFSVAALPTRQMIEPEKMEDLARQARRTLKLPPESDGIGPKCHEIILRAAKAAGAPALDLKPALEAAHAAQPQVPLYWRIDFHLSAFGQKPVAGALRAFL